jgi:hypothetical protein
VLAEGNEPIMHFVGNMTLSWIQWKFGSAERCLFDANST